MTNDEIIKFFQDEIDNGSDESAVRIGRAIERAAREAAIEECAQLCERRAQKVASVTRHSEGHVLAAAIRALREGK